MEIVYTQKLSAIRALRRGYSGKNISKGILHGQKDIYYAIDDLLDRKFRQRSCLLVYSWTIVPGADRFIDYHVDKRAKAWITGSNKNLRHR